MWFEQAWCVFRKDVLLEARARTNINAMLFFAGAILLTFSFALGPDRARLQVAAGGLLWLAFIFAGMLAFGRAFQLEMENQAFEGLLLIARARSAIYAGKLLGTVTAMLLVECLVIPLMGLLYTIDLWRDVPSLALICLLGTVGFASVGTLYGALTMSLRAREVLLPLLLLPVTAPVILGAVKASTAVLAGQTADLHIWLGLLVVFDLVFVTVGLLLFEYATGE